jgi:2-amino-4-hydroxy-6-hydroxymethyldihydropteridine diphosphokinase
MDTSVFIGVGSNIEPEKNIKEALFLLLKYVNVLDISTHYLTKACGNPEDPDYINGVWKIKTGLGFMDLKCDVLRKIENTMGRKRTDKKYAARKIDLDILLFGDRVIKSRAGTVPDMYIYKRPFVCIPVSELEPEYILPDTKRSISDVAGEFNKTGMTPLYEFTEKLKLQIRNFKKQELKIE